MKKLVLVLILIATTATMQGQSQLKTVRGRTRDGKTVSVQYYKGTIEDNIESVKYQVVDELEARVKALQIETRDLQSKLYTANKQINQLEQLLIEEEENQDSIGSLQDTLDKKTEKIKALHLQIDSLDTQMRQLIIEKADLEAQLDSVIDAAAQDRENYCPKSTPVVGTEINAGLMLYGKTLNESWQPEKQLSQQASVYFGTARFFHSFPLSVEAGINIHQMGMKASRSGYDKIIKKLKDANGNWYDAHYSYSELGEKLTLTYLGIPIRVCFGQPLRNNVSVYAKLGVTPSFQISKQFEGSGTYTLTSHYEQYNIAPSDIEESSFVSNTPCYTSESQPETKVFVLWGNIALGACLPFGHSPIQLNLGIKADCSLTPIGKATTNVALPDGTGLLQKESFILIPAATIGIIYTITIKQNH